MIWFLVMCSAIYDGTYTRSVCTAPVAMPSRQGCLYVRQQTLALAKRDYAPDVRIQCVGVNR